MIACWAINSNSPLVSTIKQHRCSVYIHKGKLLMSKGRLTGLDTSALPCLQSRLTKSRTFSYKDWFSPPASQAVLRMLLLPGFLVARLRHHPLGRLTRGNLAPDSLLHIARTMRLPTKNSLSGESDLNRQPQTWKDHALPVELPPHVATMLPTIALVNYRSSEHSEAQYCALVVVASTSCAIVRTRSGGEVSVAHRTDGLDWMW